MCKNPFCLACKGDKIRRQIAKGWRDGSLWRVCPEQMFAGGWHLTAPLGIA